MGLLPVLCIEFYQDIGEHDIEPSPGIRINPIWALLQAPTLFNLPTIPNGISMPVNLGIYGSLIQLYPRPFVRPAPSPASKCTSMHSLTRANFLFDDASTSIYRHVISISLRLQSTATQKIQVVRLWTSCTRPYQDIYEICGVWSG